MGSQAGVLGMREVVWAGVRSPGDEEGGGVWGPGVLGMREEVGSGVLESWR